MKVISYSNMPARLPALTTAVGWLLLDRFDAPGWAHGAFWTIMICVWAVFLVTFITQEQTEVVFKDEK